MDHFWYLFAAYSIIFAAIFLYVAFMWSRQSKLEVEVRALEAKLAALGNSGANPATPEHPPAES